MDSLETLRAFDPESEIVLLEDPVAQWLDWEEQANLVGFRASTRPVEVSLSAVEADRLEIFVLPGAPDAIVQRFFRGVRVSGGERGDERGGKGAGDAVDRIGKVLCARHPLNRDEGVAWFDTPVDERWSARFTSSRTLAMFGAESGAALFSLKLATDHPHPDFHQPEKTKLREEALGAVEWVRQLARMDALLEPLEGVDLITEVLVVLERGGESGFLVRDLRILQDGRYTLPALSLPFVGRQIARQRGEDFATFWAKHYAEPVGRAKARLMARYGLWFETPNPQNLLVRLDSRLAPTGGVVVRDVGDGDCATDAFTCSDRPWSKLTSDLRPETQNSFWAFGEAGEHSIDRETLEGWYAIHDEAYFGELALCFPTIAPEASLDPAARLDHWNRALRTAIGEEAVADFFAAHGRARRPDR